MELCSAPLSIFTKNESSRSLSMAEIAYIMQGLHQGLDYLHGENIIHRFGKIVLQAQKHF